MQVIDAHLHFWEYEANKHDWINTDMAVIQKDMMPETLQPILERNQVSAGIAVQVEENEQDNLFMLQLAEQYPFIKAVIGWLDFLEPNNFQERLQFYKAQHPALKGFRYMLQAKEDRALMLHHTFKNNMGLLNEYGYTYDLLILPDQLAYAYQLAAEFPHQKFIIDHLGKPPIKSQTFQNWQKDIKRIAELPNVFCKVSGMVTEADWRNWAYEHIVPYLDIVTQAFGTKRLIYGSDWPVSMVAAPYQGVLSLVKSYFSSYSASEQEDIFKNNAMNFYNIKTL